MSKKLLFASFSVLSVCIAFGQNKKVNSDSLQTIPANISNPYGNFLLATDSATTNAKELKTAYQENFDQLVKLPEFQKAKKWVDSLRKCAGHKVNVHLDYNEKPFLDDGSTGLARTTISVQIKDGKSFKMLTVFFDQSQRKIVSVEDHINNTKRMPGSAIDWNTVNKPKE